MIVECPENELTELTSFCWNIAKDKTRYGFPRFESFEQLSKRFLKTIKHPTDKLLVYYENEKLLGALNLLVDDQAYYLQAIGGIFTNSSFDKVADLFIEYLMLHYQGYDFHIGFPVEHVTANQYFKRKNATLLDASLTMKLSPQQFHPKPAKYSIKKVDKEHFNRYAEFHDKHFSSIYWNSARILEQFNTWHLFYLQQDEFVKGSLFVRQNNPTQLEVYGLIVENDDCMKEAEFHLLNQALILVLTHESQEVLFFVDEDDLTVYQACLNIGFKQIDTYRSYQLKL